MTTEPTEAQIQRAILDEILASGVRAPGEVFKPTAIQFALDKKFGIRSDPFYSALNALGELGYFEKAPSPTFLKLTEAGFAAL